jgi:hypothetical protein
MCFYRIKAISPKDESQFLQKVRKIMVDEVVVWNSLTKKSR